MTLTPAGYKPRIIDAELARYLKLFGAVEIHGPKWCGKTWAGLNQSHDKVYVADSANNYATRRLAQIDPVSVLQGAYPLLVDEWQEGPGLWDAARASVDQTAATGLYILTGSAQPRRAETIHSGTGRIIGIKMLPMTLFESGDSTAEVSLRHIFDNPKAKIIGRSSHALDDIIALAVRGGWPRTIERTAEDGALIAKQYINSIVSSKSIEANGSRYSPAKLEIFLRSFSRNTATMVSNATIRKDTTSKSEGELARATVSAYLDYLQRIYMIWEQPAWLPELRSATRLRTAPKRHLADPSLAAASMNAGVQKLKKDLLTFGFIFETMVARDLQVYVQSMGGQLCHYRDNSNLEIDAIVEMDDGRVAAIEVKLGAAQEDEAAANLHRFSKKIQDGGAAAPAFLATIIGTGGFAHTRSDGVHVIPIGCLAP
jgi:predicted AAA+ superfamily ATPase